MKVTLIDSMGSDARSVDAARVSLRKLSSDYDIDKNIKLINYLALHEHFTPFTHNVITLHVEMPIFLARQHFKHQIGSSKNEVSRRYVSDKPSFWWPFIWRKKPTNGIKQGSGGELSLEDVISVDKAFSEALSSCSQAYNKMLETGVCPEQARSILPLATYTEFYDTGSLVYWARLYNLRSEEGAQQEWKTICEQIDEILSPLFPNSWKALIKDNK